MKKRLITLLAACCLLAALSISASALEYTFDSPSTGDFGTPTSAGATIREREDPNTDKSKNSALIPPGFGTPTSYLPNSGEYLTPNLAAGGPINSPSLNGTMTGSAGGGTVLLPGAIDMPTSSYPTNSAPVNNTPSGTEYTDVTSDLYYNNGSLGTLKIPAIGLSVKVVQGTDSKALACRPQNVWPHTNSKSYTTSETSPRCHPGLSQGGQEGHCTSLGHLIT